MTLKIRDLKTGQRFEITLSGVVSGTLNHEFVRVRFDSEAGPPGLTTIVALPNDSKVVSLSVELPPPAAGDTLTYGGAVYDLLAVVEGYWVVKSRNYSGGAPAIFPPDAFAAYTRTPKKEA